VTHEKYAGRVFDLATLLIEGKPRRAMRVYCYRCGKPGTCVANAMAYGAGSEDREHRMAARKFTNMGWEVDLIRGKHFCPDCQTSPQVREQPMKKEDVQEATIVPMVASAGRKMEPADRRVIYEKMNEVYLDDKGYAPPWTDETLAKDLGVPRAWVMQIREEMFGPLASNSNIDDAVKAARELAVELKKHTEQASKLDSAAATMLKQLETIIKAVGAR
jgi:hypothetical protein